MRGLLRAGTGATLAVSIMFIGSFVMWVGTPLGWLWIGSQIQGATGSLGLALTVMFSGAVATVTMLAMLLARLSNSYRENCLARGLGDPGHVVLEGVLVLSASVTLVVFVLWFFIFSGSSPVPVGIHM